MSRCPHCRKPLDSPSTGVPRVIDARVVVYCSLACRDQARLGRSWDRGLRWLAAAAAVPAQGTVRALSRLAFPPERLVMGL